MSKSIEMGQFFFGNPTGNFWTPVYADALVDSILSTIGRVFSNREQREWDQREDPKIDGIEFHPYWWGDKDAPEASLPNLRFQNVEIRWYKHPGRGQTVNLELTPTRWCEWHDEAIAHLDAIDLKNLGEALGGPL